MQNDQRLTPLPKALEIKEVAGDYSSGYPAFYDDEGMEGRRSLRQYFDVVYKRLPLIIALSLLTTVAAAFYMYRQPSVYAATTQMIIEPRKPKVTSKDAINISFGTDANYYNTQLQLLRNVDLMRTVVRDLQLYKDPNLFDNGSSFSLRSIFSSEKTASQNDSTLPVISENSLKGEDPALSKEEQERVDSYAARLVGGLNVEQREKTNIVNVTVQNTKPAVARAVADKTAEVFRDQDAKREMAGAVQAKEDLERSIEELRTTIDNDEQELMALMRRSNLPLQENGQQLNASRLQSMSETYLKALESRRQLEGRYNAATQASSRGEGMNIPDLYENRIFQDTMRLNTERKAKLQDQIRDIEKQIQENETEKAELLVKYTPEYFKVKEKEEKIASLKAARNKTETEVSKIIDQDQKKIEKDAVGGALVSLKAQVDAKRKEESQALAAYEREAAVANIQGQAATELTTKKREIETKRNLLDTYTQRVKEQELAIANSSPDNIKVAAKAGEASLVGPARTRNILVAFLVSLAAGIGLAFLMDYLDDSVKSSEDVGRHLGLPTLALIPQHNVADKRRIAIGSGSPKTSELASATAMITLEERNSPMAEAYRHLRTSLLFSSAGKPPQTILITSSQPSEGKTTTAINTAVTLAQSNADVVLIDCDLRRPRLHTYFGLENTNGLTNYLSGERNTDNFIKTCAGLPKLKVITSGPIPPNPAELLSSVEMKNLLTFLRERYQHIIIDSPPAISFTDAAILSTQVDGVVLVAMAGKSSLHLMRRFKQRLGNIGARIYGVVLNGIKSNSTEYYYYGSGYYDYYGKGADDPTEYLEDREK